MGCARRLADPWLRAVPPPGAKAQERGWFIFRVLDPPMLGTIDHALTGMAIGLRAFGAGGYCLMRLRRGWILLNSATLDAGDVCEWRGLARVLF